MVNCNGAEIGISHDASPSIRRFAPFKLLNIESKQSGITLASLFTTVLASNPSRLEVVSAWALRFPVKSSGFGG